MKQTIRLPNGKKDQGCPKAISPSHPKAHNVRATKQKRLRSSKKFKAPRVNKRSSVPRRVIEDTRQVPGQQTRTPVARFSCQYLLDKGAQLAFAAADILTPIDLKSGNALQPDQPVLNTLQEMVVANIRPELTVGYLGRYHRYTKKVIFPHGPNSILARAKYNAMVDPNHSNPRIVQDAADTNSIVILDNDGMEPLTVLNYLKTKASVTLLGFEPPVGITKLFDHGDYCEVKIERSEDRIAIHNNGANSQETGIPFWYDRRIIGVGTSKLVWTRHKVAKHYYLYKFSYVDNDYGESKPMKYLREEKLPDVKIEQEMDALPILSKAFKMKFTAYDNRYISIDRKIQIPFELVTTVLSNVTFKTINNEYSGNMRKYISRQIKNTKLEESYKLALMYKAESFVLFVKKHRYHVAKQRIKKFFSFCAIWDTRLINMSMLIPEDYSKLFKRVCGIGMLLVMVLVMNHFLTTFLATTMVEAKLFGVEGEVGFYSDPPFSPTAYDANYGIDLWFNILIYFLFGIMIAWILKFVLFILKLIFRLIRWMLRPLRALMPCNMIPTVNVDFVIIWMFFIRWYFQQFRGLLRLMYMHLRSNVLFFIIFYKNILPAYTATNIEQTVIGPELDDGLLLSIVIITIAAGVILVYGIYTYYFSPRAGGLIYPMRSLIVFTVSAVVNSIMIHRYSNTGHRRWLVAGIFVALIVFPVLGQTNSVKLWDNFQDNIYNDRESYDLEVAIPWNKAAFNDFETLVDPEDYPMNPGARLQIREIKETYRSKPAVVAVGLVFDAKVPIVHSKSQYNLVCALRTRALLDMPPGNVNSWNILDEQMRGMIKIRDHGGYPDYYGDEVEFNNHTYKPHGRVTWKEYVNRFPGPKRDKLNKFWQRRLDNLIEEKHYHYSTFIKREKIMGIGKSTFTPLRPRVIQGCSEATKVTAGPWFLNYSYALKNAWNPLQPIWYCSGYDSGMYNAWFNYTVKRFGGVDNCLFVGSDFSKYDVTQGEHCMDREAKWYETLGFLKLENGNWVLKLKKKYTGYGDEVKYVMLGTRKSGENDTSSGNSKNTGESIYTYWKLIGADVAMAVLGDDNFTIIRKDSLKVKISKVLEGLKSWISSLGYKLKIQASHIPEQVEFLSSRFYATRNGYRIGKKPGRVLTKIGYFMKKQHLSKDGYFEYLKGSLLSLGPVIQHVPFLRTYAKVVLDYLAKVKPRFNIRAQQYKMQNGGQLYEADDETWLGFEQVYDLTSSDEKVFENHLLKWVNEMPAMVSSPYVDKMVLVDDAL